MNVIQSDLGHQDISITVYAIIFAYRYFHGFGLGAEIREGLISRFF